MKNILWIVTLPTLLLACSHGTDGEHAGTTDYRSVVVEGEKRDFILHIPKGVAPAGAGLILAFHGYGGTAIGFQRSTDLDRIARETGSIIAYLEAASPYWAEDCDCVEADRTHLAADTAFVSSVMDGLSTELALSPSRRFAVGFSQGGFFVHRLACQMAERFQAVVEVAATMAGPLADRCAPTRPVSHLMVLSKRDDSIPWEGAEQGVFSTLGAEETAAFWGSLNQCDAQPLRTQDGQVLRVTYEGCSTGARVELIGTEDGDHFWDVSPSLGLRGEVIRFLGG